MSGRARAEQRAPKEEKWKRAPAFQMEFSTASIVPVDMGESRKTLIVRQSPVSPSLGSDSLQSMISDPDNVIALGSIIEPIAASRCWMNVRTSESYQR